MAMFHSGMELLLNAMGLLVLLFGGLLIMDGELTLAELITFNLYVASIQSPIRRLAQFVEQFNTGMAGFHRFQEVMREKPDIVDAPDAKPLKNVEGDIRFEDVTFAYEEGRSVLEHVNLHIPSGQMLALVGPSGGGKTTLCQLIPRFYEVREGAILLDGQDIRSLKLADLRGAIGIVQQDVFLFAGSVLENIRYGRPDATFEEVDGSGETGGNSRRHPANAGWIRYRGGRARHFALRWAKTARFHRAHLPQEPAHSDPG